MREYIYKKVLRLTYVLKSDVSGIENEIIDYTELSSKGIWSKRR